MNNETILVTGAGGVLGSSFRRIARDYPEYQWSFWTSHDYNLTDSLEAESGVYDILPDYIIHTAALAGGNMLAQKHPAAMLRDNVLMDLNILEAARVMGVKKVIMTLSGGMYPPMDTMLTEDSIYNGPAHGSNAPYAYAKRLIEPAIRSYRDEYGLSAIGLVPDAMYGPNDYFGEDGNMCAGLIRKFYEASRRGGKVEIWGDGSPIRQLTYAEDVARVYMWMLRNYDDASIVNVASDQIVHVSEVAGYLKDITSANLDFNVNKPSGPAMKVLDTTRLHELMPDIKWTQLADGLKRTFDWYAMTMLEDPNSIRMGNKVKS